VSRRGRRVGAATGAALALIGALGVALGSGPYLSLDSLSAWIVIWALGLFAALVALPFLLHARITEGEGDRDRRWELAVVGWGGITLGLAALLAFAGALAGFDSDRPLGALAISGLAVCGLTVGSILALMLTVG
jgi:hypothetical protein